MKKLICFLFACITLSGCESLEQMHQQWVAKHCNVDAAHNEGLTDGLTPGQLRIMIMLCHVQITTMPSITLIWKDSLRRQSPPNPDQYQQNVTVDKAASSGTQ